MKLIKYNLIKHVNIGTEENPKIVNQRGSEVVIRCSVDSLESNLEIARKESFEEPTIDDDGIEEIIEPTQLDRVEAQVTYTAMMTDTLLEV